MGSVLPKKKQISIKQETRSKNSWHRIKLKLCNISNVASLIFLAAFFTGIYFFFFSDPSFDFPLKKLAYTHGNIVIGFVFTALKMFNLRNNIVIFSTQALWNLTMSTKFIG